MKNLLPILTFACLLSCQSNGDETKSAQVHASSVEIDVTKTETMIGQTLEKVQAACDAAKVRHRVVEVDGESRIGTRDYLPDRLNFRVAKGKVIAVTKG